MKRCKGVVGHSNILHIIIIAMTNSADATEFLTSYLGLTYKQMSQEGFYTREAI